MSPYPPGWGGTTTDTTQQRTCGGGTVPGSFATNYASPNYNREKKTSEMNDPAKWVVVGDCGTNAERDKSVNYAYSDFCDIACNSDPTCGADWVNCPDTQECSGPLNSTPEWDFQTNVQLRKTYQYSRPRHLGGSNIGFGDGHASWFASEAILFGGRAGDYLPAGNLFENVGNCGFAPYP